MPKMMTITVRACAAVLATVLFMVVPTAVRAQDVRPLQPILEPVERDNPAPEQETPPSDLVPLPNAPSRVEAASRARIRVSGLLPPNWMAVARAYEPVWMGVETPGGFSVASWHPYFAAAGFAPVLTPHPFFSPWGMLAYEGWMYDLYRSVWTGGGATGRMSEASNWLQRGDREMAFGRAAEAARAYRRVTQAAPDLSLGYLGLGAALAGLGDHAGAAAAFRQSLDRYPGWLGLNVDWSSLFVAPERLDAALRLAADAARDGDPAATLVAGILYMFGGDPTTGRTFLATLTGDPHAPTLLSRGPR